MIDDRLGATPLVLQLPIGSEADFVGIVDLIKYKAIIWKDETLGAEFEIKEIPADLQDTAAKAREALIELAIEQDDTVMEAYLEGNEPSEEVLINCIRKGTIALDFVPVLCGSAF